MIGTARQESQTRQARKLSLERPQRVRQFVLRHVLRTVPLSVLERGLPVSRYAEAVALYDGGDDLFSGDEVFDGAVSSSRSRGSESSPKQGGGHEDDNVPPYLRHPSLHRSLDAAYDSIYRNSVTEKIGELIHSIFK